MTPHQRKLQAALARAYLADLRERVLRVACPACGAKKRKPCLHHDGPRKGRPMAGHHGARAHAANLAGLVKGPAYWRARKN